MGYCQEIPSQLNGHNGMGIPGVQFEQDTPGQPLFILSAPRHLTEGLLLGVLDVFAVNLAVIHSGSRREKLSGFQTSSSGKNGMSEARGRCGRRDQGINMAGDRRPVLLPTDSL